MASRFLLLRVALVGALCSTALALTLNVEHAVDAGNFVRCGRIVFDDSVLIGQGGSGVFARTSSAPPQGAASARYYTLRIGTDDADAVTTSVPVGCLAASGGAAPLVLDLLADGRLAAVAVACPVGGSGAGSLPEALVSEQAVEIRFPAKAADVQEVVPAAVAAEQKQRVATEALEADDKLTPEQKAMAKRKMEDENKTWLQKNWIMLVPAAFIAPASEDGDRFVQAADGGNFLAFADKLTQTVSETFTGDGTAFSEAVDNTGAAFACSFRYLNNWASQYFVAMNAAQWADGEVCGSCVRARCVDKRCPIQNVDVVAMVVDKCPECAHGALDFSYPAYSAVTGSWPNRLTVSWEFVDCSSLIDGTIKMWPKDGGNAFWQAFYFANTKYQLQSVTLNGEPLQRQTFGFWIHAGSAPTGPCELVFTAVNGATVTAKLDSVFSQQDLDVQFPVTSDTAIAVAGR